MYVCRNFSTYFIIFLSLTSQHLWSTTAGSVELTSAQQFWQYASFSAQGFLDRLNFAIPSQGGNGTGTTFLPFSISNRTVSNDVCFATALQPDGCIILAGTTVAPNNNLYCALARYLQSGELDQTFGGGATGARPGTQYINFNIAGGTSDRIRAILLQPDGKIVASVETSNTFNNERFGIARFLSNGQLDTSFNSTGANPGTNYINFNISGNITGDIPSCIGLQNNGKIIVGGFSKIPGHNYFALACFLPNGQLDTTFGGNTTGGYTAPQGTQNIHFPIAGAGNNDSANGLVIQDNGNILLGGYSNNFFAVARFLPNGALDTTFNQAGIPATNPGTQYINFHIAGGASDQGQAIILQTDGKILLNGTSNDGVNTLFSVARFTSAGVLDTTFNQTGTPATHPGTQYVTFTIAGGANDVSNSIAVQSDNKIILGGYSNNAFALARFLSNGTLDTYTFGTVGNTKAGTTFIPFSISGQPAGDFARGVLLQPDGNIVLAGSTKK